MRYIRLAFLSISERKGSAVMLVIQLTVMLLLINLMISSVGSRTMLTDTYRSVLDKQGWFVSYYREPTEEETEKHISLTPEMLCSELEELLDSLEVRPERQYLSEMPVDLESGEQGHLVVLPDRFYKDMTLPAADSSMLTGYDMTVFPAGTGLRAGDSFTFTVLDITQWQYKSVQAKVSSLLTDPTYIPSFTHWAEGGDITMLYKKVSTETDSSAYIITSVSQAERLGLSLGGIYRFSSAMVFFPDRIDTALFAEMENRLASVSGVSLLPVSEINKKAELALRDDYRKYVPLGAVITVIVLLGTAGSIAVQTLDEMKNYAVLYLCGMKWRRTVLISICKVVILLAISLLISGGAMAVLQEHSVSAQLGLVFGRSNLTASLLLALLTLLCSAAMPFVLLRRNEPAEVMRRIKND